MIVPKFLSLSVLFPMYARELARVFLRQHAGQFGIIMAFLKTHPTIRNASTEQTDGEEKQAGAAGFGPLIGEALDKLKTFNAIMHNFYKGNAVKLGEWKTASHVERQTKHKQTLPPAP